ncbi:hypothetical protein B6U84_04070 [Candidatus Bathyarchaeota archaeon ex4484_40]|nr:MAG: hypothetical protein B6U84_04070 [Candidatus Bathyarchaeota archaeon ex4484_40]
MLRSWKSAALALLLILASFTAFVQPLQAESTTINLSEDEGPVGMEVAVYGTIETAGGKYQIYWDHVKPWDGRSGLIAEGYAEGNTYATVITIPPAYRGVHHVIVLDVMAESTAAATFNVKPEMRVEPDRGPAGLKVKVSGHLVNNEVIDIIFLNPATGDYSVVVEGAVTGSDGYFEAWFNVPQVDPGNYTVQAFLDDARPPGTPEAETPFTVLESPAIALTPNEGMAGDLVTVQGFNFAPNSNVTVYFEDEMVAAVEADDAGAFTASFNVPEMPYGGYAVKAVDDIYNIPAEASFTVHEAEISTRAALYLAGDTLSFNVKCTGRFQPNSEITIAIVDPEGVPFKTLRISADEAVKVGEWYVLPYGETVATLPSDATEDEWTWTANFRLECTPDIERTALKGDVAVINTTLGMIEVDVETLNAKVTEIDGDLATVSTALGEIQGIIASANATILEVIVPRLGTINARLTGVEQSSARVVATSTALATIFYVAIAIMVASAASSIMTLITVRKKA